MQTIEERAKSYAMQVGCFRPDLCAADYIAGAKEERILVCEQIVEWLADMVCEGVLETNNLPLAIARFKADFDIPQCAPKYYGDDDPRVE
jgi:hypothetical protein